MRAERPHRGHGQRLAQNRLGGIGSRGCEPGPTAVEFDDGDIGQAAHPPEVGIGLQRPLGQAALAAQFRGGSGCDEAAVIDDDEIVDEAFDEVELVTGEEHRGAGGGERGEDAEGALDGGGVETENGSSRTRACGSWMRAAAI